MNLVIKKWYDSSEPSTEKVVLSDECGDSMWDEVLLQESNESKKRINNKEDLPTETGDQDNEEK